VDLRVSSCILFSNHLMGSSISDQPSDGLKGVMKSQVHRVSQSTPSGIRTCECSIKASIMLYYIVNIIYIIYNPPTPAIWRGSAPEKKWLCGAFGGPAGSTCALGGPAAKTSPEAFAAFWALSLTLSPGHLPGALGWP
jgi:hypothetical protein